MIQWRKFQLKRSCILRPREHTWVPVWGATRKVGDVDAQQASDLIKMAEIAWTRVHAIINQARGDMHFK